MLLWVLAAPMVAAAYACCLGVGVLRGGDPLLISLLAGAAVLLPPAAVYAPLRKLRGMLSALGTLGWSALLMVVFPLYFPGERAEALAAGGTVLGTPFGKPLPAEWALLADEVLPGLTGRTRPAPVESVSPPDPPPAPVELAPSAPVEPSGKDAVVLPYEGQGAALSIPVVLEGASGRETEVSMIFDTGATLTTLDRKTLRRLGVAVPRDAPEITFQTANGERTSSLVMIERVWLGGLAVDGVTVGVCEPCSNDGNVGLLGLNVSRQFLVTVDQARRELVLESRAVAEDSDVDVRYWVNVQSRATKWPDGRLEVEVTATNRAPRDLDRVEIAVECGERFSVVLEDVRAGADAETSASLPLGTACDGYTVAVSGGVWSR